MKVRNTKYLDYVILCSTAIDLDINLSCLNISTEITIHDLRVRMYKENPGVQPVFVQRANFECQVLGVYKHPKFNLLMEPDVTFIGETG
jgi:hypothetical protein